MGVQFAKGYSKYYDLIYKRRDYGGEAQFVYDWANYPAHIVNLGCGTGQHHKYWLCPVIGVEQSRDMLKYIKIDKKKGDKCFYADIENLPKSLQNFKCYFALFNVIGYCNLENILSCLNQPSGGIFIFDVWTKDKFDKEGFTEKIKRFKWGSRTIRPFETDYSDGSYRQILEIIVKPKGQVGIVEYHSVRAYSLHEIEELCRKYSYKGERKDTDNWTVWYKLTKE